jgi:hypothetical protein
MTAPQKGAFSAFQRPVKAVGPTPIKVPALRTDNSSVSGTSKDLSGGTTPPKYCNKQLLRSSEEGSAKLSEASTALNSSFVQNPKPFQSSTPPQANQPVAFTNLSNVTKFN